MTRRGVHLGIDFGIKRVGLALSDPDGLFALPHATHHRTTKAALFEELLGLVAARSVAAIVLGLPLDSRDTEEGEPALILRQIRNFGASLKRRTELPVYLMDESCSSAEAEEQLREAGLSGRALTDKLDAQAAALILQSFLDQPEAETRCEQIPLTHPISP